jgi:hypothetical protein
VRPVDPAGERRRFLAQPAFLAELFERAPKAWDRERAIVEASAVARQAGTDTRPLLSRGRRAKRGRRTAYPIKITDQASKGTKGRLPYVRGVLRRGALRKARLLAQAQGARRGHVPQEHLWRQDVRGTLRPHRPARPLGAGVHRHQAAGAGNRHRGAEAPPIGCGLPSGASEHQVSAVRPLHPAAGMARYTFDPWNAAMCA